MGAGQSGRECGKLPRAGNGPYLLLLKGTDDHDFRFSPFAVDRKADCTISRHSIASILRYALTEKCNWHTPSNVFTKVRLASEQAPPVMPIPIDLKTQSVILCKAEYTCQLNSIVSGSLPCGVSCSSLG
jgi:hypothetical protein